ncbi:glycosyltransferase involved in cell wall biosynthesis [Azospirillum brasilense]|uniref:Glycosyltransferase involved in cell wall biosynthesis n=1 Tax=Azospirillum brasilense TaxID=192 RepID=A0A560AJY5_AZOBR|nr:glycosyltransferase family 4 protein [Azospirillum brasilense]TWA60680.1 glycosyltransferase involved in cell wall biosynthesis [Azospirillum brasilense]
MDSPSILFVNRVFPPDKGATGRCVRDVAERMAAMGWRVTVVADGSGPSAAPPGVTVCRTGWGRSSKAGAMPGDVRATTRGYLAAALRLIHRALRLPRHDVVVTMTDPPLLVCAGPLIAARHAAASLHWSQDVFPALLPVLGVHLPDPAMRMVERASVRALRRQDAVVAIGRCMAGRLAAVGVPAERITVLPNWPDPDIRPVPRAENPFRREHGLGDRFTVAYSGNMGLAHPMDAVLDAAALLARSDPAIAILLIGDGRRRAAVAEAVERRGLTNVRLLPLQPSDRLAESLSAADLHLATMDLRAEGLLVPSKVAGALAAGRPCLFLGPAGSDAAALLDGCGQRLAPDDAAGLAAAIRHYAGDPALCAAQGARALSVAAAWDAAAAARRFAALADGLRRRTPLGVPVLPGRSLPHA